MVKQRARQITDVIAVLAGVVGCGSPPPCGLRVCDVRDPECQRLVARSAACMRQVPEVAVPVNVIARAEYIRQAIETVLTPEEESRFRGWNAGLALFGLAPPDLAPSQAASAHASWVGAFYSYVEKEITIVDGGWDMESLEAVALLVHEYVHAIQDASFDLDLLYEQHAPDRDRRMAVAAVIEGEATYVGDRAQIGLFGDVPEDVPWDRVFRRWQEEARGHALASSLPVTLAYLDFSYPFGTEFLHKTIGAEGWAGANALFAVPPSGVREVLAGFRAPEPAGGPWAEDLGADAVPVPVHFSLVYADRMGAWIVGRYFDREAVAPGPVAADGLRGDVLSVFRDDVTQTAVAVWRLRFSSAELAATVAAGVEFRFDVFARLVDRDVILFAAGDASNLAGIVDAPFGPLPTTSAVVEGDHGSTREIRCALRTGDSTF